MMDDGGHEEEERRQLRVQRDLFLCFYFVVTLIHHAVVTRDNQITDSCCDAAGESRS